MIENNIKRIRISYRHTVYDHIKSIFEEAFEMGISGNYRDAHDAWSKSIASFDYDTASLNDRDLQPDLLEEEMAG
jgi:hypothetical protein